MSLSRLQSALAAYDRLLARHVAGEAPEPPLSPLLMAAREVCATLPQDAPVDAPAPDGASMPGEVTAGRSCDPGGVFQNEGPEAEAPSPSPRLNQSRGGEADSSGPAAPAKVKNSSGPGEVPDELVLVGAQEGARARAGFERRRREDEQDYMAWSVGW